MTRSFFAAGATLRPLRLLAVAVLWVLFSGTGALAVTINVVDAQGDPISTGFRWLLEEDNSNQSTPQVPSATSIGLSIHKSHAPALDSGLASGASVSISVPDPTRRYFLSVLPNAGYAMSGAVILPGAVSVTVTVNAYDPATPYNPAFPDIPGIPTTQISVLVFEDNWPINNAPDNGEPPLEGFTVVIADAAGVLSQDVFGNPLGTTYVSDGSGTLQINQLGSGVIKTDANGKALVKYLAPGKYGVTINPPTIDPVTQQPVEWIQTATIEGTPTVDAWVKANEAETFVEGFGTGFVHTFFGFVRLDTLPWAVAPPTVGNDGVTPYSGSITGVNRFNHFSRPPNLQGYFPGAPVGECFVGLNDPVSGQGLIAVACDDASRFTISGVPPGTYQLVTWDRPLDALFGFNSVVIPAVGSPSGDAVDLGTVLSFRWFGQLKGSVFNDRDEDGFRDCVTHDCNNHDAGDEIGILEQNINIRFRDGTIYQAQPTDVAGEYDLAEVFPFFKWLVTEVDFASFKATGMTAAVDSGGPIPTPNGWTVPSFGVLNPQPQATINRNTGNNLSRTETGPVLTQAMHLFLGQANVIDWGKANYRPGENGGISGIVYYAVTRAEADPRWAAAEPWEPGIPRVQVALYRDGNQDGIIDDLDNDGLPTPADVDNYPFGNFPGPHGEDIDHNGNGVFDTGDAIQITTTDSWDDNPPSGCIQTLPIVAGQQAAECFDNFGTWNQVRPGVFDGGYAFTSYFPGGISSGSRETQGLPPGYYIVEAANPNPKAYVLVKEEEKNVDFGDAWTPSPLLTPPACVGAPHTVPPYLSLQTSDGGYTALSGIADLIDAPFAGQTRPLCDRKQVRVIDTLNTAADFFYTTLVPKAARLVGFANNDLSAEFDPTSPIFGEKSAPSWLPVSLRDWNGNELVRVYMDEYGAYNALLPSTFTVNLPSPTGVSPNMVLVVLNDPGPIPDPNNPGEFITDPNHDPNYSVTPWTFQFESGRSSYLDTPLVPVAAFVGYPKGALDTQPRDGTPVISRVAGADDLALACNDGTTVLTIFSAGPTLVDNPDYNPQDPASVAQITRDFGFGNQQDNQGKVTVGGVELEILSWSADIITARWFATDLPATGLLKVTRGNGLASPTGLTVNVIDCATAGTTVKRVPADYPTIQAAVDAADPGDLILVAPGLYKENVIMYKPVTLQGSGPGATTISAAPVPTERIAQWHQKLRGILGLPLNQNDPFVPKENPAIMVFGRDTTAYPGTTALDFNLAPARIDGFQLTGSIAGAGIYVDHAAVGLDIANNLIQNNQGIHGAGIVIGTPQIGTSGNHGIRIHDNRIQRNGGVQGGGGIHLYADSDGYEIRDNIITGNFSRFSGGGISHTGVSPDGLIAGNQILFNEVFYGLLQPGGGSGGGIYVAGELAGAIGEGAGDVTISGNLIQGNLAGAGTGGGIAAFAVNGGADPAALAYTLTVANNMIVNNVAALGGGGLSLQDVLHGDIHFNTIAANDSATTAALAFPANNLDISTPRAGGLLSFTHSLSLQALVGVGSYSDPELDSNIFWGNRSFFNDANLHGGRGGLVPASLHASSDQLYYEALLAGDPATPYLPDLTPYPDLWDLQVYGAPAGARLSPVNSILSSLTGPFGEDYAADNLSVDPGFLKTYNNALVSSTVADEGGNSTSLRYRPLTVEAGDYHLATACSPAIDGGNDRGLATDLDGDDRVALSPPDIGADEFNAATQTPHLPVLTLFKPQAGELVPAGSRYTLYWGAPAQATQFDLGYSLASGLPLYSLAREVGDRCFVWDVPANIRNRNDVRIGLIARDAGAAELDRVISAPFTIDVIALHAPNGGELLVAGTTYTITWTPEHAPTATRAGLWYRLAGQPEWLTIGTTAATRGRLDWRLPSVAATTQATVGLALYDDAGRAVLSDYSDATFTIFPAGVPATPAIAPASGSVTPASAGVLLMGSGHLAAPAAAATVPTVTLLLPDGGEYLTPGEEIPVLWISPESPDTVAGVQLLLSTDGGSTWETLALTEGDPESFSWIVPVLAQPTEAALLEIRRLAEDGSLVDADRSDAPFAISAEVP